MSLRVINDRLQELRGRLVWRIALVRCVVARRDPLYRDNGWPYRVVFANAGLPEYLAEALEERGDLLLRTIVFVDESGLSERPTRVKTWAPKDKRRSCNTASTGRSCR
jgi:hypothetical protein